MRTIGALLASQVTPFHSEILLGMKDAAAHGGANFLALVCGALKPRNRSTRLRNFLTSMANTHNLDGLVIPTSTIFRFLSTEEERLVLTCFGDLPIISLGADLEGYHCVKTDNTGGMAQVVSHLVQTHARRRILLVRGVATNSSSNERQIGYEQALRSAGISIDPDLVVMDDPDNQSGERVISSVISRSLRFDAVVTTNDNVAILVMDALKKRGFRVPEDISVASFQGTSKAETSTPPLTTVSEGMYAQGYYAVSNLLAKLDGKDIPACDLLKPELLVRRSCGCSDTGASSDEEFFRRQFAHLSDPSILPEKRFEAFRDMMQTRRSLSDNEMANFKLTIADLFRKIASTVETHVDFAEVAGILNKVLGCRQLYHVAMDMRSPDPNKGTLGTAYRDGSFEPLPPGGLVFDIRNILPQDYLPRNKPWSCIVEPLFFIENSFGYVIFDITERVVAVYESVRIILSYALNSMWQYREIRQAEERFADIAHSTSDWLWETDAEALFTYSSDGIRELLGLSSAQILGTSLPQLALPEFRATLEALLKGGKAGNRETRTSEFWATHVNGEKRGLLLRGVPVFDTMGTFIGCRGIISDITESIRNREKISSLAFYDQLTKLPNRSLLGERFAQAFIHSEKKGSLVAVFFLDLDGFKEINDTHGHRIGDLTLQKVAMRISGKIRKQDTLARFGGDEFVLLMNIKQAVEVEPVADKILSVLAPPFQIEGRRLELSASIGIAVRPAHGTTPEELLRAADIAMYQAKEAGKNCWRLFADPEDATAP